MSKPKILPPDWYFKDPSAAAAELIGKIIIRVVADKKRLSCRITETEAYYGPDDPASRARKGGDLREVMKGPPGHALVYGIHRQWLFNVVSHKIGEYGAVLIRSCEPLEGIELMKANRGTDNIFLLTTGPGRLTQALLIDKGFHKKPVFTQKYGLWIERGPPVRKKDIVRTWRIGVTEDLETPLRFVLVTSRFISKPPGVKGSWRMKEKGM